MLIDISLTSKIRPLEDDNDDESFIAHRNRWRTQLLYAAARPYLYDALCRERREPDAVFDGINPTVLPIYLYNTISVSVYKYT